MSSWIFLLGFYSFIPSLIMHGTKLGRNLEGCTEKELCYSEKGVVSMLTGFFSVHVSIRQTPKPSVQMAAGSTLPATRHGLLL